MKIVCFLTIFYIAMSFYASSQPVALYPNEILFSGIKWGIKSHALEMGPGNNLFGLHKKNTYTDNSGRLILEIRKTQQGWSCAEVVSNILVGEGKFEFTLETDITRLKPNMVLGLFLYNDLNPPTYDEIDIEFSQWGQPQEQNAQYVVHKKNSFDKNRFSIPKGIKKTTHSIEITTDNIIFVSQWLNKRVEHSVPRPVSFTTNGLRIRLNLWLYQPNSMVLRYPKVVVSNVSYTPR